MNATQALTASLYAEKLIARLYHALDMHQPEQLGTFFTAEGVWNRQGKALRGAEAIFAELSQRPKGRTTLHIVSNFVADPISDREMQTAYYLTVFRHDSDGAVKLPIAMSLPFAAIVCRARVVLVGEQWLIADLSSQTLFQ
jgi:hypothetical protein